MGIQVEDVENARAEFVGVAADLERLAEECDGPLGESDDGENVRAKTTGSGLRSRYRVLLRRAGALLVECAESGMLTIEGLTEFLVARDASEWGGMLATPENFFALFVGGPRIDIYVSSGHRLEVEKPNQGWPLQYRPAAPQIRSSAKLAASVDDGRPDPQQCRRLAQACRQFAGELWKDVPPRARKAGEQYEYAKRIQGDSCEDDQAYSFLDEALRKDSMLSQELGKLPKLESWKRNLRLFRAATGNQKHVSRADRDQSARSVVRRSDLD